MNTRDSIAAIMLVCVAVLLPAAVVGTMLFGRRSS